MVTNYSKWINTVFVILVVCTFSVVIFTEKVHAATQLYILSRNNIVFNQTNAIPAEHVPNDEESSYPFVVGKVTIDDIFYSDVLFSNTYREFTDGVVTNFNFKPMTCTYQSQTAMLSVDDFVGSKIYIYLPTISAYNASAQPIFSNTYEWVSVEIGGDYGTIQDLFLNTTSVHHKNFSSWHSTDGTYWHFMVDTRGSRLDTFYRGSYYNYSDSDYLAYIFEAYHWLTTRNTSIPLVYTDWLYDIDFFPGVLTFEQKTELEKLENIQGDLDELLNSGSGQFDDTKDQMQDASDKAEQGNQDIQNNAPKPDINDTVNDTSDVIDEALSGESFDKISDLLSAIFANTLISTILLISVAVGAVKYIFFGKG